ncbi:MAG: NB-ARC domain-containing protein [Streptosporangiaceae bacterium]
MLAADPALAFGPPSAADGPTPAAGGASAGSAALADGPAARSPVVPAQLPADTVDFTGREEEVKLLCDLLAAPSDPERPRAVVISAVAGMGGIGKTALAVHAGHRLLERFPDGQLYISLRGATSPLRPSEVLALLLRGLGEPDAAIPAGEEERAARYRSLLAGRRMPVVADDARDAAQVRPLLPGSAGCAVIVTSRGVLAGLAGAAQLSLGVLGEEEALRLFAAIVGAPRAAAEPEATAAVLACCSGLPLAIRIAGARLASRPGWSIARLAARLASERDRLAELTAGDLALRASFAVSYDALAADGSGARALPGPAGPGSADPARVFRLLGLASMAELSLPAVAALAGQPPGQVAAALETLTDAHLLESPEPDRYRLHDLLRSYAAELARHTDSQEEQDAAIGRILHWYAGQAVAAARLLTPAHTLPVLIPAQAASPTTMTDAAEALGWYEAELANLGAAASQAAARGLPAVAAQIPIAMLRFFQLTPYNDACLAMSESGVRSARRLAGDAALSSALMVLGWAYNMTGRPGDAGRCIAEALEIRRRAGDRVGETMALRFQGVILSLGFNLDSRYIRV